MAPPRGGPRFGYAHGVSSNAVNATPGDEVWRRLLRQHGPITPVSALAPSEAAVALASGRVFWVDAVSDGCGSGDVRFRLAEAGQRLDREVQHLESHEAFVFRDASFTPGPFLAGTSSPVPVLTTEC